jgi:putative redox protein
VAPLPDKKETWKRAFQLRFPQNILNYRRSFFLKATVTMDQGMTFTASADSGFTLQMGASPNVGGQNDGFRPMELMLMGLGGCTAMDVISILRKKRQDVTGFDILLDAEQAENHPHVFTEITIKYIFRGNQIDPKAVERSIRLSDTKYCPAQAMLARSVSIKHTYEIIEEEVIPDGAP